MFAYPGQKEMDWDRTHLPNRAFYTISAGSNILKLGSLRVISRSNSESLEVHESLVSDS